VAKHSAIFLDRDGTLIEDVGYIKLPSQITFYGNVYKALKLLQRDFLLFIITNQSGIGKGELTADEVEGINTAISKRFYAEGIHIKKIYVCPHTKEDNCECRKPNPYFVYKASEEFNIDLSNSYFIGDHPEDIYCAEQAGVTGIYLLTGHGVRHYHELKQKPVIKPNILEAAKFITNKIIINVGSYERKSE
jgi:D-glycero-D-manno-heptose 1,7-bisphosphate phosphatase